MAQLDAVERLLAGFFECRPIARLDEDAKQRVGVEHRLRRRNWNDDDFVGIHTQALTALRQHADHPKAPIAEPDHLPDCRLGAEQFLANLRPQDRNRRRLRSVVGQEAALRHGHPADGNVIGRGADDRDIAQFAAERRLRRTDGDRRGAQHCRRTQQRLGIADRQIARGVGDRIGRIETTGARAAGQDDDQVRPQRGKLIHYVAARAVAQRRQHNHRGNADAHRQDHQAGAQRIAAGGAGGKAQEIGVSHDSSRTL